MPSPWDMPEPPTDPPEPREEPEYLWGRIVDDGDRAYEAWVDEQMEVSGE